ncbi:hypothetical protein [Streptomyces sp. NPDC059631]|uniref:hypothetical protein n=1 Tax=unclassified Streptomyces TaxID=2593676 RepID=UPI00367790DC
MSTDNPAAEYVTVTYYDQRSPEIRDAAPDTPGAMPREEAEYYIGSSQTYDDLIDLDG